MHESDKFILKNIHLEDFGIRSLMSPDQKSIVIGVSGRDILIHLLNGHGWLPSLAGQRTYFIDPESEYNQSNFWVERSFVADDGTTLTFDMVKALIGLGIKL